MQRDWITQSLLAWTSPSFFPELSLQKTKKRTNKRSRAKRKHCSPIMAIAFGVEFTITPFGCSLASLVQCHEIRALSRQDPFGKRYEIRTQKLSNQPRRHAVTCPKSLEN